MNAAPTGNRPEVADGRGSFMAFVCDRQTEDMIKDTVEQLELPQASILRGNIQTAIRKLEDVRSPKMLLVDLSESDLPLTDINALANVCEPGVTVITIGARNDVGLFRDLMAVGVADYLVKPITPELLTSALTNALEHGGSGRRGKVTVAARVIAFIGARGGVGTSMVATSCAWLLANEIRRRVALLDLDLHGGTDALYLDVPPSPGLHEALDDPSRIDSLFVERVATRVSDRLVVLSSDTPLETVLNPAAGAIDALLGELRQQFHYVLIDVPRTLTDAARHVLSLADAVVIVSDQTLAAMRDTARLLQMLASVAPKASRLVVSNREGEFRQGVVTAEEFSRQAGRPIDIHLPFDKTVTEALLNGFPVPTRKTPLTKMLQKLANRLSGRADWTEPGSAPGSRSKGVGAVAPLVGWMVGKK